MTTHELSADAKALSLALSERIRQAIQSQGPLPFSRYMQIALYEPGLGYYSAGLPKLGAAGDFITAPMLGNLFARGFAHAFAALLPELEQAVILEPGAGTGVLARDVLLALQEQDCLPAEYWILETSAHLRQVQRETLAALPESLQQRLRWLDEPPTKAFNGIIFANEVIDALPVEVFRRNRQSPSGFDRLHVITESSGFAEQWLPMDAALAEEIPEPCQDLADGYRSEFLPQLSPWLQAITGHLQRGAVFLVDYGYARRDYYHPQRHSGTLVCHHRHQANFDPLQLPGLQDITAFVDFTAVAEALDAAGCSIEGFTTQGAFLLENGIEKHLGSAEDAQYSRYYQRASEFKQLVLPAEMGEKFKVLWASKGLLDSESAQVPGFSSDFLYTL